MTTDAIVEETAAAARATAHRMGEIARAVQEVAKDFPEAAAVLALPQGVLLRVGVALMKMDESVRPATLVPADFNGPRFPRSQVRWRERDPGMDRRFHLQFAYLGDTAANPAPQVMWGDALEHAEDMGQAAARIARGRVARDAKGVARLLVLKRYFGGKPAVDAAIINRIYEVEFPEGI